MELQKMKELLIADCIDLGMERSKIDRNLKKREEKRNCKCSVYMV